MSWLDHAIEWVDRLPGPAWLFYLLAASASASLLVGVQRILLSDPSAGSVPFQAFVGIQPWLVLGTAHAVRSSAKRSFAKFRPLLPETAMAASEAEFRVINAPARSVLLASLVAALAIPPLMLGVVGAGAESQLPSLGFAAGPASTAVVWAYAAILAACLGGFAVHLVHQLRTIARLVGEVTTIDLYRLEPAYAFSSTTALAAILLTLDNYLWYAVQPALLRDPFSLSMGAFSGGLALVAFAWPVWGAHGLLAKEKALALALNGAAFKELSRTLHQQVSGGQLTGMDQVGSAMTSLDLERAAIGRIPTWPWHAETLRTILAAVFLPMIIWLAQYVLSRALGG